MENSEGKRSKSKMDRKLRRAQHIVEKETGAKCTTIITKHIALCNAGLVNGLREEVVYDCFSKYGPLEQIAMLEGKSCAFVSFRSPACAMLAYDNINGKLNIAQDEKPIYLSYVEDVPDKVAQKIDYSELPTGLRVLEDFITEPEENALLKLCTFDTNSSNLKHRQVKHYGFEFRYDINNVDKGNPLPEPIPNECNFLWKRLKNQGLNISDPDQLTINCYEPGQGIPPHIDTHSAFENNILSLSLGSPVIMDFRHDDGRHLAVLLPQRSLVIMSNESRYIWTHGITPRKTDIIPTKNGLTVIQRKTRISLTFRKILTGECYCDYVDKCDSYNKRDSMEIKDEVAAELEKLHVMDVYNDIADHFSNTRYKPWPNILDYVHSFEPGSVLLDVGCGNGKYLGHNKTIFEIGCDCSSPLLNLCRDKNFETFCCNCLNIPLRAGIADGVISIAVIHHLATSERRMQAIKEITRILRVNGTALIYVWAKDQFKNFIKSSYLKQNRKNRKSNASLEPSSEKTVTFKDISLPVHTNRTQFQHQDVFVPWKLQEEGQEHQRSFLRFYHVFEDGELESLCKLLDNVEIVKSYYNQGNWCVILKKVR